MLAMRLPYKSMISLPGFHLKFLSFPLLSESIFHVHLVLEPLPFFLLPPEVVLKLPDPLLVLPPLAFLLLSALLLFL